MGAPAGEEEKGRNGEGMEVRKGCLEICGLREEEEEDGIVNVVRSGGDDELIECQRYAYEEGFERSQLMLKLRD